MFTLRRTAVVGTCVAVLASITGCVADPPPPITEKERRIELGDRYHHLGNDPQAVSPRDIGYDASRSQVKLSKNGCNIILTEHPTQHTVAALLYRVGLTKNPVQVSPIPATVHDFEPWLAQFGCVE